MPTVAEAYELAVQLLKARRLTEAEQLCRQILSAAPRHADTLHLCGLVAHNQGRSEQAVELIAQAIAVNGRDASYHNNIGEAYRALGRLGDAILSYQRAIALNDRFGEAFNNLGAAFKEIGRIDEALACYQRALDLNPGLAAAHMHLGTALQAKGRLEEAEASYRHALGIDPDLAAARMHLGTLLQLRGRPGEALENLQRAVGIRPGFLAAELHLGNLLLEMGRAEEAIACYRRILAAKPDFLEAHRNLGIAMERLVPLWQFPMVNDAPRNDAFEAALKAAVRPGSTVLDIGTGTGLLAMMAARAGAGRVVACEAVEAIAGKAREIVARNGLADRVAVVHKLSTALEPGADLPEPADLLVTEILASDLLSENVLGTVLDARARLLKPGAPVIPCAVAVRGMLVGGPVAAGLTHVGMVSGFDLSPFNDFAPHRRFVPGSGHDWERLSDDMDLLGFDLQNAAAFPAERRSVTVTATRSGRCHGVLQWIWMRLHGDTTFENHPLDGNPMSGWQPILHGFAEPLDLAAGDTVRLIAWHNRSHPSILLDPAAR